MLLGGSTNDGTRFFLVVPSDMTRNNGHVLKHMKFHLNTAKHFFCWKGGQTLDRVAQKDCAVSFCWYIQNLTGHSPGQPTIWACLNRGSKPDDLQRSLPNSVIRRFSDVNLRQLGSFAFQEVVLRPGLLDYEEKGGRKRVSQTLLFTKMLNELCFHMTWNRNNSEVEQFGRV